MPPTNANVSDPHLDQVQAALDAELERFVANDPGRSVAVLTLDGPETRADIGGDTPRAAASFVKVLLAIALYEEAGRGRIDLDQLVPRRELKDTMYPSILAAFADDRDLSVRELCAFTLITSDNPAAEYLRGLVGDQPIRATAEHLVLRATRAEAGYGDDDLGDNSGNATTANEALRVMLYVEQTSELRELRHFMVNGVRNQRIPLRLDDDIQVMHKTGSLETVALDAGIIYGHHRRIALAYFCDDQPDTVITSLNIGDSALRIHRLLDRPPQ